MASVGLMTFSDGRPYVNDLIREFAQSAADEIEAFLSGNGYQVVRASEVISNSELARDEARRLAAARPIVTVYHYPVWAFPHFTMIAAAETPNPILLLGSLDPQQPGMVGMLAGGGALDQIGRAHQREWGDLADEALQTRLLANLRGASAAASLRGTTFGLIGGRPMGMYTAVSNTDDWMARFGIDVEHIDQWEIVRRSELVDPHRAQAGRAWFENLANVHYDEKFTPLVLERQIRSYLAVQELVQEWRLDFIGIKGQPELTTHFATMDVAEALLNDPYDWEGEKDPLITATEADMDGALTMQLLRALSGTPVLFADVRHYHADRDIWDLANSGQHATWFAARDQDPAVNLARVHLYPEVFFFPAGGGSIHHIAAPGDFTLARLTRLSGRYRMQVVRGTFEDFGEETNNQLARMSTFEWPHAFARLDADASEFLSRFGANHIHAIPGDHVVELESVCRLLDIDFDRIGPRRVN